MNEEQIDMAAMGSQMSSLATNTTASQVYLEEQQTALAEKQLNVKKIRTECYYILKQYNWNPSNKENEWSPQNKDTRQKNVLTDWGVDRIMQLIHFYVNESNLLSNFSMEQINYLMLKFMTELNDLVLLKYEHLFVQPSFEECKEILEKRIDEKTKIKMYAMEMVGQNPDERRVKKQILAEVEKRIEYEMAKIKQHQLKERLREYGLIIAQLEVIILGALNRALNGEERGSLRRHTQMLEMLGGTNPTQAKETGGMFKWLKG